MVIMDDGNGPRPSPRGLEVLWFPLAVSLLSLELTFSLFFLKSLLILSDFSLSQKFCLSNFLSYLLLFFFFILFFLFSKVFALSKSYLLLFSLLLFGFVSIPSICIVILQRDAVLNIVIVHVPATVPLEIGNGFNQCADEDKKR